MKATKISTPLVAAIENAWGAMQANHADLPDVVVTLGSGIVARGVKLGHFAANVWARGGEEGTVHELFVGGEGLMLGAEAVMATLLHEASHAVAEARTVNDVSRNGRYHNGNFKTIAEEMGIEVHHSKELGWSETTMPEATAKKYEGAIFDLDLAITAYRAGITLQPSTTGGTATPVALPTRKGGRTNSNNGVSLKCNCGRRIRISNTGADMGSITCGVCGSDFI